VCVWRVCVCACGCVCIAYVCVCLSMSVSLYVCLYVCVCVRLSICLCLYIRMSICLFVRHALVRIKTVVFRSCLRGHCGLAFRSRECEMRISRIRLACALSQPMVWWELSRTSARFHLVSPPREAILRGCRPWSDSPGSLHRGRPRHLPPWAAGCRGQAERMCGSMCSHRKRLNVCWASCQSSHDL